MLFLIFCQCFLELFSCTLKFFLEFVHGEAAGLEFFDDFALEEWEGLGEFLIEGIEIMFAFFDLFGEIEGDHLEFFFEGIE